VLLAASLSIPGVERSGLALEPSSGVQDPLCNMLEEAILLHPSEEESSPWSFPPMFA